MTWNSSYGLCLHIAARESTNIPLNLLAQLATYLKQATDTYQKITPGTSHTLIEDQLSEALELPHGYRWELPTTIANVVSPPQLNPQHVINPPRSAVTLQDTTDIATHRPLLPPVTPCILDKLCKVNTAVYWFLHTHHKGNVWHTRACNTNFFYPWTHPFKWFIHYSTHQCLVRGMEHFLAIMVDHNPAKASQLIAYQTIITSASRQYPLNAWLNLWHPIPYHSS